MKIQCDVCNKASASFFCPADDAALCAACDSRVHQVNKLAGKHQRFSLTVPSSSIPLCDICQENRAFLFCQQDRAILCRDCDYSIHNADKNTHRHNHNRFLLTGTRLSPHSSSSPPPPPSHSADNYLRNAGPVQNVKPIIANHPMPPAPAPFPDQNIGGATSSISEYLIETLPGWRVDDFLDCNDHTFDLSMGGEEELVLMSIWESEFRSSFTPITLSEDSTIWLPHTLIPTPNGEIVAKNTKEGVSFSNWIEEDRSFTVPQILNSSNGGNRSRFA